MYHFAHKSIIIKKKKMMKWTVMKLKTQNQNRVIVQIQILMKILMIWVIEESVSLLCMHGTPKILRKERYVTSWSNNYMINQVDRSLKFASLERIPNIFCRYFKNISTLVKKQMKRWGGFNIQYLMSNRVKGYFCLRMKPRMMMISNALVSLHILTSQVKWLISMKITPCRLI